MLYWAMLLGSVMFIILVACQNGIPTRHPSDMEGYWETTIPMRDAMTWDEWCTTQGAFLTQGSALRRTHDQLQYRWKNSARAGGMTQQQYLEGQEYCGKPWQQGAGAPSFTNRPALYLEENEWGILMIPPRIFLPEDDPPTREDLMILWGVGHIAFAEGSHRAGFTDTEIATAWTRATRLMGFTRADWNEAMRNYHKAAKYDVRSVDTEPQ